MLQIFMEKNPTCLAVIPLDSALKKGGNNYLQVLLNQCKYIDIKFDILLMTWKFLLIILMILMKSKLKI